MVSVVIVSYNSSAYLDACLASLARQDYTPLEILVVDNASQDATREILSRRRGELRSILNGANVGFAAGVNLGIRAAHGEWVLSLNPDVLLAEDFIREMVAAGTAQPSAGMVSGKLLRWRPGEQPERTNVLDSTGIFFRRNLRHLDRGSDELDRGQYDRPEFVFGVTGAAALYRRAMIEDVSLDGEFLDEEFFAYREDADLAWRAQMFGWSCVYSPSAVAWHVRRVTPERLRVLPLPIRWHSVKNRFLMRVKNIGSGLAVRLFFPVLLRDLLIAGYAAFVDWRLLSALAYPWTHVRGVLRKRRTIQSRRRVADSALARWFSDQPASFPLPRPAESAIPAPTAVFRETVATR